MPISIIPPPPLPLKKSFAKEVRAVSPDPVDCIKIEPLYNEGLLTVGDVARYLNDVPEDDLWVTLIDRVWSTSFAASVFNHANLSPSRAADIFNNPNLPVSRIREILEDANISADRVQSILYSMAEKKYLARLLDIMTLDAPSATLGAVTTYSGVKRFRVLDLNGYEYIADGQPHVIVAYEVRDSAGGGVISKTYTGGAGGAGSSPGTRYLCSGGGGGHPPGAGGPDYGKPGGDVTLVTYGTYTDLALDVIKAVIDWFIQNVLGKTPSTTRSIPSWYGAGGGGGGSGDNEPGQPGEMAVVGTDSPGAGGDGQGSSDTAATWDGRGGNGGGGLIIIARSINGVTIEANGEDGVPNVDKYYGGGGGSGGHLIAIVEEALNSTLRANGGNGGAGSTTTGGGGGGGIVYLMYTKSVSGITLEALGGSGYQSGGSGTAIAVQI